MFCWMCQPWQNQGTLELGGDGGSSFRSINEDGFSMTDIFDSSRRCSSNDGGKGENNVGEFHDVDSF